jgi:ATP-dependent helicase HrpA
MQHAPAQQPPLVSPQKADAIHRALLAGLLGNVGTKSESHEFTGARGTKFSIFPGSSLFKRNPQWVTAAELVETTKLYARTAAPIHPDWIEAVGSHLVKRQYTDPKWDKDRAQVVSTEKVSLYSLILVPARRIHYGPVDPRTSREIFIQHALVEGQFKSDAPFFRHNLAMRAQVERMEAKLRERGLLADVKERFRFFDARVPHDIHEGCTFDLWWRSAERRNPRLLFMSLHDMLAPRVQPPSINQYPDELRVEGLVLPLDYVYDAAHAADGVTATIPLAALGQVPAAAMEWLVPGSLREKIDALIRSLPKDLRKNFIPIADTARDAASTLSFGHGSLVDALALFLGKKAGLQIPRQAFDLSALPPHLQMNFRITDAAGKQIAIGRDLARIRADLRVEVKSSFAQLPLSEHNRDNLTHWDFGDLPERVPVHRHGMTLWGYPALIDKGGSVSIRLLDSPEAASQATRAGARRLFMIQLGKEITQISRSLKNIDQMCLYFKTIGSCAELKQDLLSAIVDHAMFSETAELRTQAEFIRRASDGWRRLSTLGVELTDLTWQILHEYHALRRELEKVYPPMVQRSVADLRDQLSHLAFKGFLSATPNPWIRHLPRFLRGMEVRLRKLMNAGLSRDAASLAHVQPLWDLYKQRQSVYRQQGRTDSNLVLFRWMIEELRVSLFAQELKASVPVSVQRLEKIWEQIPA